jgi:hypothetical protein
VAALQLNSFAQIMTLLCPPSGGHFYPLRGHLARMFPEIYVPTQAFVNPNNV